MATAAILAQFDALEWAGASLFTRNATSVAAPAASTMHDLGHYPDVVALLNGWGSRMTLAQTIQATWGLDGTITCGIDDDDRFYVQVLNAAGQLTLTPGPSDPWGWGGVRTSSTILTSERITASRRWTRGPFIADTEAQFIIDDGVGLETQPGHASTAHSLPSYITASGSMDADAVTETLEKWDNAAIDSTHKRIKWGVDSEGRTFTSWPSSGLGAAYDVTWSSTSFRRALGFTGLETATVANGVYTLTSTYPARGVCIVRQGLATIDRGLTIRGSSSEDAGGRVSGRKYMSGRDVDVSFQLRGGVGLAESLAPHRDEESQFLRRVAPFLSRGARVTICPEWGDSRIGRSLVDQFDDADTPAAFSATVRSEGGGVMGRLRAYVADDAAQAFALRFDGRARSLTAPVSLRLRRVAD